MIPKIHFRGESDQWTEARMWFWRPHSSTDYCIRLVNSLLWRRDVPSRSKRSLSIRRVKPNPDGWGRIWLTKIWTDAIQMTSSKHIFSPRFIPHKMFQNYILLHVFIKKMLFGEFFNQKVRASPCFCWLFWVFWPAGSHIWETPRQPIEVRRRGWGSLLGGPRREPSQLPIGWLGVIYDSQPHVNTLFYSHPD
jgi:hypothetical protein